MSATMNTIETFNKTQDKQANRWQIMLLGCLGLLFFPLQLFAAASLDSITYSTLPGNKVQVKMSLSGDVTEPLSFSIEDPARIAIDFTDTTNNLPKKTQSINTGSARSVTAVQAGNRTRVVLNLVRMSPYDIKRDGNNVLLTLNNLGGTTALKSTADRSKAVIAASGSHSINNVDFRRGTTGEGRVIIGLSDANTPYDLRIEGGNIVVDFIETSIQENLERRLDVVDFATPVKMVDTFTKGNNVRMVIEPQTPDYEHLAYQSDNTLIVDVKPLTKAEQEAIKKKKFGFVGEKLSLNFQNIEVRAVLQLIADFTGLNLVTSDTVAGNLTLRLKNVPWDQALDIILKTKGLDKRQIGNVLLIAPTEEIAAREKLELESMKQIEELAPLRSEYIQVNYAKAGELAKLLKGDANKLLSERGNVTVDERTNTLLVQDTGDKLAEVRNLVSTLDIPIRQVLIESRIVVANDDFSKDLGVRFGLTNRSLSFGDNPRDRGNVVVTGNLDGTVDLINAANNPNPTDSDIALELGDSLNVNLPAAPADGVAATIGLAIAKLPFGTLLNLELSALQQEGRGETIANPRVITANQNEALIESGTEIPFLEASSAGNATVSFKKAVLSLKVTPQITPDDRIIMDLIVTQDTVGDVITLFNSNVPSINTQEVQTQVLVDNGETIVLGGIYQRRSRNQSSRVPFFGDLPYVGFLFKQNQKTDTKQELLIFVTPKILKDTLKLN